MWCLIFCWLGYFFHFSYYFYTVYQIKWVNFIPGYIGCGVSTGLQGYSLWFGKPSLQSSTKRYRRAFLFVLNPTTKRNQTTSNLFVVEFMREAWIYYEVEFPSGFKKKSFHSRLSYGTETYTVTKGNFLEIMRRELKNAKNNFRGIQKLTVRNYSGQNSCGNHSTPQIF